MKKKLVIVEAIAVVLLIGLVLFLIFWRKSERPEDVPMDVSSYRPVISVTPTVGVSEEGVTPTVESIEVDYLAGVRRVNSDVVAWLTLPDTNIDYPILQSEDNEFYMSKNLLKEYNRAGTPFLDYRVEKDFSGFNSIIYGHNMASKQMFADLTKYKNKDFFDSHPEGEIIFTDRVCRFKIIACLVIKNDDFAYEAIFPAKADKERFLETLKEKARFYREPGEKIDLLETGVITLSTCSYEFENARTVLVGYAE